MLDRSQAELQRERSQVRLLPACETMGAAAGSLESAKPRAVLVDFGRRAQVMVAAAPSQREMLATPAIEDAAATTATS